MTTGRRTTAKRTTSRKVAAIGAAGVVALLTAMHSSPVSAQTVDVPIGDNFLNAAPGSLVTIATKDVPADLAGRSCNLSVTVTNQSSVHPGNALVITSGDTKVTVEKVEETANSVVTGTGVLTLGSNVTVALQLGNEGLSSLGSSAKVTCEALPPAPPPTPIVKTPTFTG